MENNKQEPKIYGYVARNVDGTVSFFQVKPNRVGERWWDRDYAFIPLNDWDFPEITWDSEPVMVEMVVKKLNIKQNERRKIK